jgi:hypothetical protein
MTDDIKNETDDENQDIQYEMPSIDYDSTNVYVGKSEVHLRGVFAKKDMEFNTIVEVFPITPTFFRTKYQADPQILSYGFINSGCPCQECKKHGYVIYLSSGYGSMYNHQPESNARIELNYKDLYGKIIAKKPIRKDEEIFISYPSTALFHNGVVINHENSPRD